MSDLTQILITSFLTVFSGVIIFSLTKLFEVFYIKHINRLNQLRGEVAHKLILHANKFGNMDEDKEVLKEASIDLRVLASELRSNVYLIRNYKLLSILGLVLLKDQLFTASTELIGLSNSMLGDNFSVINNRKEIIKQNLDIHT